MENNSKEFRKAQRTTIHCTDGNEIYIMDDDILKEHYEFYTTKGKKSDQRTIAEDEKSYLKEVEKMLRISSKDKVLNYIYSDYNNNKISRELLKKALAVLEQNKKVETAKVETAKVETAKVETRTLSKEEAKELEKLMEGKHKITRIYEDEEFEK